MFSGYFHRDLKPENIFISFDGILKIGDFGLAKCRNEKVKEDIIHSKGCGDRRYMSPEQQANQPYNHKVDIYALGIIFLEMTHPNITIHEISKIRDGDISADIFNLEHLSIVFSSQEIPRLISEKFELMISNDPNVRPEASTLLQDFEAIKYKLST